MTIPYTPRTKTGLATRTNRIGSCDVRKTAPVVSVLAAAFSLFLAGCNQSAPGADDEGDFAPGAFPPTLSDTEYHQKSWSRASCLTCHESGLEGAPKVLHTSLPAEAKQVKCRSCHVLIPGSQPQY